MAKNTSSSGVDGVDVQVVGSDQRDASTGQTPGGLHRFEVVSNKLTGCTTCGWAMPCSIPAA